MRRRRPLGVDTQHNDEALLLRQLFKELNRVESLASAGQLATDFLCRLFQARNVAIFFSCDTVAASGQDQEAAQSSRLTGLEDPIVRECLETKATVRRNSGGSSELFPQDPHAVACPLSGGVLYVGGGSPATEPRLPRLAESLSHFFESVRMRLALQSELGQAEDDRLRYRQALEGAESLAATLPSMSGSLQREEFLEQFAHNVQALLAFKSGVYMAGNGVTFCLHDGGLTEQQKRSLETLAALASAQPTLHLGLKASPYEGLSELGKEMLASKVEGLTESFGYLFLVSHDHQPFGEHQRLLMRLLANLLGLGLSMSKFHTQAVEHQAKVANSGRMATVGQLASGLAHELNNPLGSIMLAIDSSKKLVLTRPNLVPPILEQAEIAAERAQEVVHSLLYFSRDAVKGKKTEDLAVVVGEALAVVGPSLAADEVELQVAELPSGMELYCNSGELAQVICHLVWNARDAVLSGDFDKKIALRVRVVEGDWCLEVRDRGGGVPVELREKIFDPFFTTREVGLGTGLGLSVSREIARDHGGTLRCLDCRVGAHFELRLPFQPTT